MANSSASLQKSPEPSPQYAIRKIIVAHDGSPAAENALKDAIEITREFTAEIILARVELPGEDFSSTALATGKSEDTADLEHIQKELTKQGLSFWDLGFEFGTARKGRVPNLINAGRAIRHRTRI